MSRVGLRFWSAALALAVFLVDVLTPLEGAVAVLYVVAILLAAKTARRNDILFAATGCVVLTIAAYLLSHDLQTIASPALRALVSLAAITITTLPALQNQAATNRLAAQARLLNLSHDMIFVRNRLGVITFRNEAAEQAYGWSAAGAAKIHRGNVMRRMGVRTLADLVRKGEALGISRNSKQPTKPEYSFGEARSGA